MPYAGPTILQSDQDVVSSDTSGVVALTDVVAGSRLVAIETSSSSDVASVSTITDTQSNVWTKQVTKSQGDRTTAIWTAVAGSAGACTVTATYSTSSNWVLTVVETDPATIADTDSESFGSSTTTHNSAASPGVSGDANTLIIAGCSLAASTSSWTAGSGFTLLYSSTSSTHATAIQSGEFETAPSNELAPFTSGTARAHSAALITLVTPAAASGEYTGFQGRKGLQRTGFKQR